MNVEDALTPEALEHMSESIAQFGQEYIEDELPESHCNLFTPLAKLFGKHYTELVDEESMNSTSMDTKSVVAKFICGIMESNWDRFVALRVASKIALGKKYEVESYYPYLRQIMNNSKGFKFRKLPVEKLIKYDETGKCLQLLKQVLCNVHQNTERHAAYFIINSLINAVHRIKCTDDMKELEDLLSKMSADV